jgi:inner membrane protein
MDNLTHTLSGLVLARLSKKPGESDPLSLRTRMIVAAVATNVPDLDIVLAPFSSQLYLLHHRGETHSLLMLPFWALLLSWLFGKFFRHPGGWRPFYMLVALSLLIHILLDWITGYGTQLLAPISDHRFALGFTFIIDPVLAGLFLLGAALPALLKSSRLPGLLHSGRPSAIAASVLAVAWISWEAVMQQQAREIGRAYAQSHGWPEASVTAEARPIAPWNWTVIVKEGERYHYAHLHLRDTPVPTPGKNANWLIKALADFQLPAKAHWQSVAQFGLGADSELARDVWARPELEFFRWFAEAPALYRVDYHFGQPCVWFEDLRFLTPGRDGPFLFGLCGPDWRVYRMGMDGLPRLYR